MKKKLFLCLLIIISLLITKNVYAETYNGEYSIDYLLRNYNVVTLGHNNNNNNNLLNTFTGYNNTNYNYYYDYRLFIGMEKGNLTNISSVDGAILINGNYTSNNNATFGTNTGTTKSYIKGTKGNNVTTPSSLVTDSNYIDLNKLYVQIMSESMALANNTEYYINDKKLEISKPGIYTINNTATSTLNYTNNNILLIKNYDKNSYYIFNMYDEFVNYIPAISIMDNNSPNAITLEDYINSGNYTGNIIFNFPNARFIIISNYINYFYRIAGSIIAPKADVYINENRTNCSSSNYTINNDYYYNSNCSEIYYGTIIANTITGNSFNIVDSYSTYGGTVYSNSYSDVYIKKSNYTISKKILEESNSNYIEETKNYNDDIYSRDYSISDILQNYSLVTLGHKKIDSKSKLLEYGNTQGSVKLFHITGPVLISGDLYSKYYENEMDEFSTRINSTLYTFKKIDKTAFDLESNKVTESFINGDIARKTNGIAAYSSTNSDQFNTRIPISVIQPWDNMDNDNISYYGKKNKLIFGEQSDYMSFSGNGNYDFELNNYINFDRLYENVVAEQSGIEAGKTLSVDSDGILHIPTGGTYTIEDISNVKEIVFDDFERNKDELTIITIKNGGDINFPLVSKDDSSKAIITNDYFGKEKATHRYELNTFLSEDSYYGNIVWNLPNAGYIKLKENAPFAGHMIAPNADVETPELHFAGCFIVNSIYGEGNTEAHFYPIRSDLKCVSHEYDSLSKTQKMRFNDYRLRKSLGGDKTTIEKEIIGDKAQYDKDVALFESLIDKCENREIIINPETAGTIAIILGIISIGFIVVLLTKKVKKSN